MSVSSLRIIVRLLQTFCLIILIVPVAFSQDATAKSKSVYEQLKSLQFSGDAASVSGLVLKRDRVEMTFDGSFYFISTADERIVGAVFIGQGKFRADVPPNEFEKDNVKRLLGADAVESDFKTAVLRFTDDTFEIIGKNRKFTETVNEQARKLATETDAKIIKETGANLSARLAISILNNEKPGFFFATFDGGKRGRFCYVLDHQTRIPVSNFNINGGEKGVIFDYKSDIYINEIWTAFPSLEDYQKGAVDYSDLNNLIDVTDYKMDIDLRDHKNRLRLEANVSFRVLSQNLRAIPFQIGESLSEFDSIRLKKQMRVKSVKFGGSEIPFVQEDWEAGCTVYFPREVQKNEKAELTFLLEGDFIRDADVVRNCFYPRSNESWYPRHGYLDRSTFDLTYRHSKNLKIASVGKRLSEEPDAQDKDKIITKYKMEHPVAFITFALGPFERHSKMVQWDKGGVPIPVEFNSLPGDYLPIKEDFILAELDNSLRYFHQIFGNYPYPIFSAAFHPFGFGQGFPSLLMIPPTDRASKYTYAFISHETAHQWWGNIVAWRSYRDQWLSEGFAEYSGMLYTGLRDSKKGREDLIGEARSSLKDPPQTVLGMGKGRLVDVGPIILGHRLNTSKTLGTYQVLIYNKGALVLRMLHFLLSNPSTGDGSPFFAMMADFVERFRNNYASTDDFRIVANEHFARTPLAQKYGLKDLNWFFKQWVYQSEHPSYQLEYQIVPQPDGSVIMKGNVIQENVPEKWFMPLPILFTFDGDKQGQALVHAYGPKTPFEMKIPMKPKKVELDPQRWILSDKTSTKSL